MQAHPPNGPERNWPVRPDISLTLQAVRVVMSEKVNRYYKLLVSQSMNPPKHSEEMPFPPGTMNLDTSKQARDYSPQTNLHIPRPHDGKHAGAIRPYRPKKGASNTPSPLGRKDQF